MTDRFVEIAEIVKRRYETGAYGDCHFVVAPDVLAAMRPIGAGQSERWLMGGGFGDLPSIPIVVDDGLPDGSWRLVQRTYDGDQPPTFRETVLRQGTLPAQHAEEKP